MSAISFAALTTRLVEGEGNFIRQAWDRLAPLPGGKLVFSRLIGFAAPYSGTIGARVLELRDDYAEVELRDRWGVRNHLASVHAIALANLAEIAGNLAVGYTMPADARFIVAGLSMNYIAKARGTLTATCAQPLPRSADRREVEVVVDIFDGRRQLVAQGTLRTLVGPKKRRE